MLRLPYSKVGNLDGRSPATQAYSGRGGGVVLRVRGYVGFVTTSARDLNIGEGGRECTGGVWLSYR